MSSQFVQPKKGGSGIIIFGILACCCLMSSSAAGGYWMGYIPSTRLYALRQALNAVNKYKESGKCKKEDLDKELNAINHAPGKGPPPGYIKNHALMTELKDEYSEIGKSCGQEWYLK